MSVEGESVGEAVARLRVAAARGLLGRSRQDVMAVIEALDSGSVSDEVEWGVLYAGAYTAAHSREMALRWCAEDDETVLVRRTPAGPWELDNGGDVRYTGVMEKNTPLPLPLKALISPDGEK